MHQINEPPSGTYPRTYSFSKYLKISLIATSLLGITLFGFLIIWAYAYEVPALIMFIVVGFSLAMIAVMTPLMSDAFRSKLIIYPDRFHFTNNPKENVIQFSEIEGYRLHTYLWDSPIYTVAGIYIIPKDKGRKKIYISNTTEDFRKILSWFNHNFTNLDSLDRQTEKESILSNTNLGVTEKERKEKLIRARRLLYGKTRWFLFGIYLWVMIFPVPYELAVTLAAFITAVGITLPFLLSGLIHLEVRSGAYPSAFILLFPGLALGTRALIDYNLLDLGNAVIFAGLLFVILAALTVWRGRKNNTKLLRFITVLFFLALYSFGFVVHCNCLLDISDPVDYTVRVLNKRTLDEKYKSWYLKVTPWGPKTTDNEIEVSLPTYDAVQVGDNVYIKEKSGLFNIRWFYTRTVDNSEKEPNKIVFPSTFSVRM